MSSPKNSLIDPSLKPAEVRAIAAEAFVYGFPIVDNYRILHSYFVDRQNPDYKAPWNQLNNVGRVFTPEDKAIQTPNSDTPYSQLGADLRAEPLVLSVPEVDEGRYYSLQFIDLYTFNFDYVGSRATGNGAGDYLLVGPGWQGDTPAGIRKVIRSETEIAFVFYRTQLLNPGDIENVRKIQAGYKVRTLSEYLGQPAPAAVPATDFASPLSPEEQRSSPDFFHVLNFALTFCPTHPSETDLRARFAKIGIRPGQAFDFSTLSPELQQAVQDGIADGWKAFEAHKRDNVDTGKLSSADGFGTREFLRNNYMNRMASAVLGIYGNSKEEAIYPAYFVDSAGEALDGRARYALKLEADKLPPVNAFWSLTVYQLPESLLYANELDRYLINSPMLPGLKRDADGGITLLLQNEAPEADSQSNWLPVPAGPFWTTLRLYWPKAEALDGRWTQPPLKRL
ncbi:DUF1254 domain-containing protein [Sandaracinobacter sp. RS1-74]|uniref:DUF1254 domain-containing protein n=1 Tax=Sandaracinobacteroides sayramensis TaxID=2913411 RepID=UPI001EDC8F80|nr:DUF1254 domain-containing protein [Sandaracinobacteroides sayramensis]MCG2841598.1 DUF1254 domain-containing protein [Sandaracinobacteroides sayramensis]